MALVSSIVISKASISNGFCIWISPRYSNAKFKTDPVSPKIPTKCWEYMTHTWCGTIAIVCEGSHDDGYSTRSIPLIKNLFYFAWIFMNTCSSPDRSFNHIRSHSISFCWVYCISECRIDTWIRSFFCGEGNELRMNVIDLWFCFCRGFFCPATVGPRHIRYEYYGIEIWGRVYEKRGKRQEVQKVRT